jgi:hypothetical protein
VCKEWLPAATRCWRWLSCTCLRLSLAQRYQWTVYDGPMDDGEIIPMQIANCGDVNGPLVMYVSRWCPRSEDAFMRWTCVCGKDCHGTKVRLLGRITCREENRLGQEHPTVIMMGRYVEQTRTSRWATWSRRELIKLAQNPERY